MPDQKPAKPGQWLPFVAAVLGGLVALAIVIGGYVLQQVQM